MNDYLPQVSSAHYQRGSYRSKDRWLSYWYQLNLVRRAGPTSVLEVGPGEGIVTEALRKEGVRVTTCDIAGDLKPDVVASVTRLPFPDVSFDAVLCCEVLEHIRTEDVGTALREISRVAQKHVIISLPHPGYVFLFNAKLPLLPLITLFTKLPFFWRIHVFDGQHYWELGTRGFPVSRFVSMAEQAGLRFERSHCPWDDPAHQFFVFKKL